MEVDNQGSHTDQRVDGGQVGHSAIKWSAIVIIVLAILYFLAKYVVPLLG